jgi:hypothetical protein
MGCQRTTFACRQRLGWDQKLQDKHDWYGAGNLQTAGTSVSKFIPEKEKIRKLLYSLAS